MKNNWIRRIILVVVGLVLGLNVYMLNASRLMGNKMPMPFGYGMAVILSGSMEPEMSVGDLIIVHESNDYVVDDVVVFQESGILITHRIVDIQEDEYVTKGDANNAEDKPIMVSNIVGEVILCVPGLGNLVNIIKSPIVSIVIIVIAMLLVEKSNEKDRKKDDDELEKIREEIRRLKEE